MADVAHEAARVAYAAGVYRREVGDMQGALDEFALAVRLDPEDPELRLALARHLIDVGSVREAQRLLENSVGHRDVAPEERVLLARLLGRTDEALHQLDAALAAAPTLVAGWLLQGRIRFDLERFEPALRSYAVADSLQPDRATTILRLGECEAKLGRTAAAEKHFQRCLQLNPELDSARTALAAVYRQTGRPQAAIEIYTQALRQDSTDAQALDALLELYIQEKNYTEGVALLAGRGEQLEPRQRYLLGWMLLQLDRLEEADAALAPLAATGVHGIENLLGEVALRREHYAEAAQHFRRAIAEKPEDCGPRVSLAAVLLEELRDDTGRVRVQGADADSVRAVLAAAARLTAADDYRCNLLLGVAYSQLRDFAAAVPRLQASHQLDPDNAGVLFDLAMAHQELGHFDTALHLGRTVLERDPGNAAALNFVGYILAERGLELDDSEGLIRKALAAEPENGYYVDSLGWVLYQRGKYEQAVTELERAVALTGNRDAIILEHLGDACVKAGRWDGAYRAYVQSRGLDPNNRGLVDKIQDVEQKLGRP